MDGGAVERTRIRSSDGASSKLKRTSRQAGRDVYRFFELFDLPNLPRVGDLMRAAADGSVRVTPPLKPFLEEKMWFALFWMQPLREFWRRELGDKYFTRLQEVIPYTWLMDPTPLPQHAVIPRLEIHDWREAGKLSQKERELLLKVSGFSPLGWGSRGVYVGQDLPGDRMAAPHRRSARDFRDDAADHAALPPCPARRAAVLGSADVRAEGDERPRPALPLLLR